MRLAVIGHAAIDLVGEDGDIRMRGEAGHERVDLRFRRDTAGRIGRRIEDDEAGAFIDQRKRLLRREGEAVFLADRHRDRFRPGGIRSSSGKSGKPGSG